MTPLYEAIVTSQGGRQGQVRSNDGVLDLKVSIPKSIGGTDAHTNPEQLFAAGYAACFENALIHIGRLQKIAVDDSSVTACVSLNISAEGTFDLKVKLEVSLPHLEKAAAERLVADAHKICPYSRATRGNIDVTIELIGYRREKSFSTT
jgi:lipoyl-dependent peroxiredoxin